jgi:hypothetical protein
MVSPFSARSTKEFGMNDMNDVEKRLAALKQSGWLGNSLKYDHLVFLLEHDEELRALIRAIAVQTGETPRVPEPAAETAAKASVAASGKPSAGGKNEAGAPAAPAEILAFLREVRQDAELAALWLGQTAWDGTAQGEGRQLLCLVARATQWQNLLDAWDALAGRCKQQGRATGPAELRLLDAALGVHNLLWDGRQAAFITAEAGAAFDYKQHERGTPTGETIRALWLPGLRNAAGQVQKKPLVGTE